MSLAPVQPAGSFEPALILVVDDLEPNRALLQDHLTLLGHRSTSACNGLEGMKKLEEETPDMILLDLSMPVMDGRTMLGLLQADPAYAQVPVIIISGIDDMDTMVACIDKGAVDYLVKPFKPKILAARIGNTLARSRLHARERELRRFTERYNEELKIRVDEQVGQICQAHLGTIFALSTLAESRDTETGAHLHRMREYCRVLARELGATHFAEDIDEDFVDLLYAASPLHDIGKVGIPDGVLLKPGRLTPEEFIIMQQHCSIGARTLQRVSDEFQDNKFLQLGIEIAECHHEKWDGSGYPRGLSGEEIPLSARILALCDVFDALTSRRCYKEAFTHESSRAILLESSGRHFDPRAVSAFLACEEDFVSICRQYAEQDEASVA